MLALVDIGNTSVTYGYYEGGRLRSFGSILYDDIPKIVKYIKESGGITNKNLVIGSVVPNITSVLKKSASSVPGLKIWIVGENLPVKINHKYRTDRRLGVDRKVNIYGALRIYRPPLLIIDFGTAITVDYVSKRGIFEGGLIIPGPEVAFQALIKRAALLPKKIRLPHKAKSFIGVTTYECMSSGILQGFGAMTDGLVERFRKRYGKTLRVIATGGFTEHLKPYAQSLEVIDPKHSIKSLFLLFRDAQKSPR